MQPATSATKAPVNARKATLAWTRAPLWLALLGAFAVALFVFVPPQMANLLIRIGRPMVHLPIHEHIAEAAGALARQVFRTPPEAYALAEVARLANVVPNAGLALFNSDGQLVWHSADFPEATHLPDFSTTIREGRVWVDLRQSTDTPPKHHFLAMVPVRQYGRVAGALLMRLDDTALWAEMHKIAQAAVGGFLLIAALFGTVVTWALLAGQKVRARARAEVLQAQNAALDQQLRLGRQMQLLAELNEWLQSARDQDELFDMVVRFFAVLLPGSRGAIYIYSNSRDVLDGAVTWGGATMHAHMHPCDCWALRRGRTYEFGQSPVAFACAHVAEAAPEPYVCLPFLAHGETIGLMTVTFPPGLAEEEKRAFRRLAQTCAEQVSLAIANVRLRDELQAQAVRDALTGLFNRRYLMDRLASLGRRQGKAPLALLALDIDHFKRFNDNHGHDAGDTVLRTVAEAIVAELSAFEGPGFACRAGGEELSVLLPDCPREKALAFAEALRARIEQTRVNYNGAPLPGVTVSIGVAVIPDHAASISELLQRADSALYTAKHRGRNTVVPADAIAPGILSGSKSVSLPAQTEPAEPISSPRDKPSPNAVAKTDAVALAAE